MRALFEIRRYVRQASSSQQAVRADTAYHETLCDRRYHLSCLPLLILFLTSRTHCLEFSLNFSIFEILSSLWALFWNDKFKALCGEVLPKASDIHPPRMADTGGIAILAVTLLSLILTYLLQNHKQSARLADTEARLKIESVRLLPEINKPHTDQSLTFSS